MTAEKVFKRAIALMDSGDEASGELDSQVTEAYRKRGLEILNLLGEEISGALPQREENWKELESYDQEVALEPGVSGGAMPYGLAAHLLLEEDPAAASFFQQRYEEALARRKRKAELEVLSVPSGGIEMGEDGRWSGWR